MCRHDPTLSNAHTHIIEIIQRSVYKLYHIYINYIRGKSLSYTKDLANILILTFISHLLIHAEYNLRTKIISLRENLNHLD